MASMLGRHAVPLRPSMQTAKSIDIARLALAGQPGGIAVSTLAEAEYFAAHGITDILYTIAIAPPKFAQISKLKAIGASMTVVTDDLDTARAMAEQPALDRVLIEIDGGDARGGIAPDNPLLLEIADALRDRLAGVMTRASHGLDGRDRTEIARTVDGTRGDAARAAGRLRAAGHEISVVSMGGTPAAPHADSLQGVTEVRAGVYMFGDLFRASIGSHGLDDIAVTVLATVIGRRPGRLLIDAGALALSGDRGTAGGLLDFGHGLMLDKLGHRAYGTATVRRVHQEQGVVELDPERPAELPVGAKVRIAPNHACRTTAAHDRYHVVAGSEKVIACWTRVNGW